jgi:hypothetical protein
MICSNCNTINENDNTFCVNCGAATTAQSIPGINSPTSAPTVQFSGQNYQPSHSIETSVVPLSQQSAAAIPHFSPLAPDAGFAQKRTNDKKFIWIGLPVVLILLLGGAAALYFASRQTTASESLPDHLGMFVQNREKNKIDEVKKFDFTNALSGRDTLLKDEALPTLDENPNLILYSDGKDIPINDLRLIQLDTIKDDGNLKQLDFQAAPVDGKPEMKRLRIPNGMANGKYAFALLDGFLNDGKHKFWAFQIKNASKNDNGDLLKATTAQLKPAATAPTTNTAVKNPVTNPVQQMPKVPPPPAGRAAYSTTSRVILRSGPTQTSAKIRNLYQSERVYIIEYSGNYESFKNLYSNFAYVQTENGQRGWVYAAYLK